MSEEVQATISTDNTEEEVSAPSTAEELRLEEMAKAGVLYGRKKSKTHPKMRPFIFTTRNGVEVFDLPRTEESLEGAKKFIADVLKKRGLILLVGTAPAAKESVMKVVEKTGLPYVTERWLGGTLTNFKTLSKRVDHYKKLQADKAAGKLDKYTKKERVVIDRKLEKMERMFGGLQKMERLPDALFVIDSVRHDIAIKEAKVADIPVLALVNSDADPDTVKHAVPANTNSHASVQWIVNQLEEAFQTPPEKPVVTSEAPADEAKKESPENK